MSHLDLSPELKALLPLRRRVELDRIPKAAWPEDANRSNLYRAFSYETQEAADTWQAYFETTFGAERVANFVIPASGRIVHLYELDRSLVQQRTQEYRNEKTAELESMRTNRGAGVTAPA